MRIFIQQLFSESGRASFSRTGSFLALVAALAWVTEIVWTTHQLPELQGLTLFISMLYGLGKAGETLQRVGRRPSPREEPESASQKKKA